MAATLTRPATRRSKSLPERSNRSPLGRPQEVTMARLPMSITFAVLLSWPQALFAQMLTAMPATRIARNRRSLAPPR